MANKEVPCSTHPDAPHGFNRTSSHTLDRYVCDCEGWVAPAVEVEGLEVIGFHCMDSTGIETLEWRGWSYADEPLCSLPKAQAVIDKQAAMIADLGREICYLMGEINGGRSDV